MFKTIFQAAALAAAVLASVPALADSPLSDVRVSYADLDLADPVDVARLDARLTNAVNAACPLDSGVVELSRRQAIERCRVAKRAEIAPLRQAALASAQSRQFLFAKAP